ncbi:MAG: ABC transporter ATP-binding protein [Fimbriimonadales bacterium]|jgi:branched-chain amino acid transport system ATP-binding protein|nr:ABC transporter ATP-binding protein [Fimbriimonadales bacterium]GBC89343.1 High-affinity branched-chain amino acid transport ATP-binding protein LivF [bacterium HR14]
MSETILEVRDLHVAYGAIQALKGVSLTVQRGEITTIIGANGAGKSTLLRAISALVRPTRGAIRYETSDITRLPPHRIVQMGIIHVPEGRRIFAEMSVYENLLLGAYSQWGRDLDERLERVFAIFPRLKERLNQRAGTLSGGEQQMLAIGRALMARPRLLMLDEPSLGLAPFLVREIFQIIRQINQQGVPILLVEQNAHMALEIAHRGYVLETGRMVLTDTAANLLRNPAVREAYLGG